MSGLIPARAGNTSPCPELPGSSRAHPRSRGEHDYAAVRGIPAGGSSPLARGTRRGAPGVLVYHGLIPARAGNTSNHVQAASETGAHPRSRGEHKRRSWRFMSGQGSSPLARGTRWTSLPSTSPAGLIPARAGNTHSGRGARGRRRAHPRSRGEHEAEDERHLLDSGSSPLARGTLRHPGHYPP